MSSNVLNPPMVLRLLIWGNPDPMVHALSQLSIHIAPSYATLDALGISFALCVLAYRAY